MTIPATGIPISYAVNVTLLVTPNATRRLKMAEIDKHSSVIAISETFEPNPEIVFSRVNFGIPANRQGLFAGHSGMSNYIFLDGHTKAFKPSATVKPGVWIDSDTNMWVPFLPDPWFPTATAATINDMYLQKLRQSEANQR